jgi:signal transduction protein with GAF and PtsI domain
MSINSEESDFSEKNSPIENISRVIDVISSSVAGYVTLPSLLDQIVRTTILTLNAEVCSIFLEDKQNSPGYLTMLAGSGFAAKLVGKTKYKIGEGFTGSVVKYGKVFNIKNRQDLEQLALQGVCDIANYDRFSAKNWVTLLRPSGS